MTEPSVALASQLAFFSCISYHNYETNNLSSAMLGHTLNSFLILEKSPIFFQLGSLLWSQLEICFAYSCCPMLCLLPRNTFHAIPISILEADRPIPTAALEDFRYQKMRRIWADDQLVIRLGLAALGIYYCDSFTYFCMPPLPEHLTPGGPSLTLMCSNMHFYHSWASAAILFVLLAMSGLCYLIHAEDDSHIVIWGMKAVEEDPPLPCQHIQTHIHNSAFVPPCLLYSHCWGYFLITRAHVLNPGVPASLRLYVQLHG